MSILKEILLMASYGIGAMLLFKIWDKLWWFIEDSSFSKWFSSKTNGFITIKDILGYILTFIVLYITMGFILPLK